MLKAILGITIGFLMGSAVPLVIMNMKISAVLFATTFDSILGATASKLQGTFDDKLMISGFLLNTFAAVMLVFLSDYIGVNIYYFALVALGIRIFKNLAVIRRHFLEKIAVK